MDICYHSYFSVTDDLRSQGHQDGKYFEIRSVVCAFNVWNYCLFYTLINYQFVSDYKPEVEFLFSYGNPQNEQNWPAC